MLHQFPFPPLSIDYQEFVLRPVAPGDLGQVERAIKDSEPQLLTFMKWAHSPLSRQELYERIVKQFANYFQGVDYEMGLFKKESQELLVYSGFYPTARINPRCMEIGFWTSTPHARKGYATLTTRMEIVLLFEHFGCDRLEITCNLTNGASRRVIEKCGFLFEAELRNHHPEPTEEMIRNGFTKERNSVLFSMIPQDKARLEWYEPLQASMKIQLLNT